MNGLTLVALLFGLPLAFFALLYAILAVGEWLEQRP